MSSYRLREPIESAFDGFSQSKPLWPGPSLCSDETDETRRRHAAAAKAESGRRSRGAFRKMATNYVIRQHLFDHLPPMDIANFVYATGMGQEIGTRELERYLHPMRHLFANAELEIISKRIAEGYAVVLWGRDLREVVDIMGEHFTRRGRPIFLTPQLRSSPRLNLAITDFSPANVPIVDKPALPDFRNRTGRIAFLHPWKRTYPTRGLHLTHYETNVAWDGSATDLPLTQYVPSSDVQGVAKHVIGGHSHIMYYINVHEQPLVLKMCYGSKAEVSRLSPHLGLQRLDAWDFEVSVKGWH